MATRGALGGLARTTADAASILDAAGFERIFIETVGVGQDEIDIVKLADITIVVLVPGMGDDVQSIKAGIMEVADIFVINKNDREGADRVQAEVKAMQSLAHGATDWTPPIVCTNSLSSEGIPELAAAIDSFRVWLAQDCRLALRRRAQWKQRLAESIRHQLFAEAALRGLDDEQLEMHAAAVACREENPFAIVTTLITDMLQRK
jgi:LAO/AO transport system kinase